MNASASSVSQWQTPATDSFRSRGGDRKDEMGLDQQARLWPTPAAGVKGPDPVRRDTGNPNSTLETAVALWPTPDARVSNDGESPGTFLARKDREKQKGQNGNGMGTPLAMAVQLWPTPAARDWKGANGEEHLANSTGSLHLDQLPNFVEHLWRTPTSTEAKRGDSPDWTPEAKAGEHSLNRQATQWLTPRVVTGTYTRDNGDPDKERLTLEGQACFHQVHPTYQVGEVRSKDRRSLNPLFVEWLMGWPQGWTLLAWIDFACSAMELSHFKQRMRSALSQLVSPPEVPAQLGLFA